MDQKRCSQCGEIKATSEFYKERRVKDGLQGHCKACQATRMKEYRLAYPEKETARRKRAVTRAHSEERAAQQKEYRDTNPEKCCSKCGLAKPLSEFHKNRTRNDGLRAQCKLCCAAADKQHHAAHREQILAQQREYRQEHRSEIAARDNQYRDTHREEIAARKKRWYEANSDRLKRHRDTHSAQRAAYNQRWRAANPDYHKRWAAAHPEERAASGKRYRATHPERVAAKNRRWCQANPEKAAAYAKQWAQEHPEKRAATQQRRRARKLGATIAPFDESQVYERDGLQCVYCGSTDDLTLDHIVPLAGGGAHSIDNLTVACQSCNGSKGVKSLVTWLATMKQSSISDREGVTRR